AALPEDRDLVPDRCRVAPADVARVAVPGHEPERLLLATAADHDRDPRPLDGLRRVQEPRRLVVPALERVFGAALAGPHPVSHLERLLEHLEPFAQRREREAETA